MPLIIQIIAVVVGCLILWAGADRFILGASAFARNLGVPPLVIGMAIVGFATSFPEMIVSAMAALNGNPTVGIGNAVGSNIANIGLVIGISALIAPISVHSKLLKREFPILIAIMLLAALLLWNLYLSRVDGLILLAGLIALIVWLIYQAVRTPSDALTAEIKLELPKKMPTWQALIWMLISLVVLLVGSRLLVYGAVNLAEHFGVSELVIGLTVVAIGTSLPELAISIVGVLKGEDDIAVGNVLGSNMFNLLAVLALPAVIHPTAIAKSFLIIDFPIMFLFTVALWFICLSKRSQSPMIKRVEGGILVLAYMMYLYWQFVAG